MELIDNSPMNKSCIGQIIEEKCSVGQFFDNCIYLIADEESPLAKEAVSLMEGFHSQKEMYFNNYELEVIQKIELKNHPKIKERIERHGDNFLIQLSTPIDIGKNSLWPKLMRFIYLMIFSLCCMQRNGLRSII